METVSSLIDMFKLVKTVNVKGEAYTISVEIEECTCDIYHYRMYKYDSAAFSAKTEKFT